MHSSLSWSNIKARAMLQSGMIPIRTLEEICELESAMTLLIHRRAAINAAGLVRCRRAGAMLERDSKDIPSIIFSRDQGVVNGAHRLFAEEEQEAVSQMPAQEQGLFVWADADLITPEVKEQLPPHTQRVSQQHVSAVMYPSCERHTVFSYAPVHVQLFGSSR